MARYDAGTAAAHGAAARPPTGQSDRPCRAMSARPQRPTGGPCLARRDAPESDLIIDETWALVQCEDQSGHVTWRVASSQNVDIDLLIGALSTRIHELRAWICESYSENEKNPYIENGEADEDDHEEDQTLGGEDGRLNEAVVEMEQLSELQRVSAVYLWLFGRNSDGAVATNFIIAESLKSTYSDPSRYIELGLLVMQKNQILQRMLNA